MATRAKTMQAAKSEDLMTVVQVAEFLQLNKLTVYKYIREGALPAIKLGRSVRVMRADVLRFLDAHRVVGTREGQRPTAAPRQAPAAAEDREQGNPGPRRRKFSREEIYVGPTRAEPSKVEEHPMASVNPLAWVIRGLH